MEARSGTLEPWTDETSGGLDDSFRILAISDREVTVKVLEAGLKGCRLECASSLSAATSDHDLILIETMVSGGTCISGAEAIRAKCPRCPIVCIMSQVSPHDRKYIQSINNVYILIKPFHKADLLRTVTEVTAALPQRDRFSRFSLWGTSAQM